MSDLFNKEKRETNYSQQASEIAFLFSFLIIIFDINNGNFEFRLYYIIGIFMFGFFIWFIFFILFLTIGENIYDKKEIKLKEKTRKKETKLIMQDEKKYNLKKNTNADNNERIEKSPNLLYFEKLLKEKEEKYIKLYKNNKDLTYNEELNKLNNDKESIIQSINNEIRKNITIINKRKVRVKFYYVNNELIGNWDRGYFIDYYTLSSHKNIDGSFSNEYSKIGGYINDLKYHHNINTIEDISKIICKEIILLQEKGFFSSIDYLIFVPPSNLNRPFQPVIEIVKNVSFRLNIPILNFFLKKNKKTTTIKNLNETEAKSTLMGAFEINNSSKVFGKIILIIDDVFGRGTTLTEIVKTIKENTNINKIFVITATKVRSSGLRNENYKNKYKNNTYNEDISLENIPF